jgi:hypothetical protein
LNHLVDTFLRLLSQIQPTLISLKYLIDGLSENAAGNCYHRGCEEYFGDAPTAASAVFHERSLKVVKLLLKLWRGMQRIVEYMHK